MFKTARVNRISQNIVEQIRDTIISGRLKPGDRLPSEKDLSVEFGVSKASLREAFRALEALGMLEVKQGWAEVHLSRKSIWKQLATTCSIIFFFRTHPSANSLNSAPLLNRKWPKLPPAKSPMPTLITWKKFEPNPGKNGSRCLFTTNWTPSFITKLPKYPVTA